MTTRTLALTVFALCAFAANSLLCRAALFRGLVDPASFTLVRLAAGAAMLGLLAAGRTPPSGSWPSAVALFAYALAFSLAYVRIPAAVGALTLFGAVQVTMVGAGLARGERPRPLEWAGLLISAAGLVALGRPGLVAPDPVGVVLMAAAGAAWGIYSLRGRRAGDPLAANAAAFARSVPLAVLAAGAGWVFSLPRASASGIALAAASGALASGLGYAVWYAALPHLTALQAAVVQLSVPPLAAAGAVLFLSEPVSLRLLLSGAAILGGVAVTLVARGTRAS